LRRLQQRKSFLNNEIAALRRKRTLPLRKLGENQIVEFAGAIRTALLSEESPATKSYLRLLVNSITIYPKHVEIVGERIALANAISKWKPGTLINQVPGIFTEWCGWQESNPRPLGS
jgi:hypothetical protein